MNFKRNSEPDREPFTLSRFMTLEDAAQHQKTLAGYLGGISMRVLPTGTPEDVAMSAAILQAENARDGVQTAASGGDGYKRLVEVVQNHADRALILIQLTAPNEEALTAYFDGFAQQQPNPEPPQPD